MKTENILDCERRSLEKVGKFLSLPNRVKKPALIIAILLFIGLIGFGFLTPGADSPTIQTGKLIVQKLILFALLLTALSREKVEDEMIAKIRGQAYQAAFISGVLYTLIQPYINYVVAILIKPEKAIFNELNTFVILWFMLVIYLCTFYLFKKTS